MKRNKGITLIALIITIIILIILTAVTINNVIGTDLIGFATKGAENYMDAGKEEQDKIDELTSYLGSENGEVKVNKPRLSDGMIPIKYDEEKQNWVITNEKDEEWYDYSEGKMLWANVMLSDGTYKEKDKNYTDDGTTEVKEEELGSMFVWIPRYAYSFNSYHTEMDGGEGTTQKITNVVFLNETSNKDFNGKEYETTYNPADVEVGNPTPMVVHPGFEFDNKQLTGIWVGKFEASMSGEKTNNINQNNIETKNTESEKCVKVLPNVNTWRYINVGNCFFNCLNMNGDNNIYGITKTKVDTHLMKNIEWGAASYLAASQYGNMPTINKSGIDEESTENYYEYSGEQDYIKNVSQSTTKNVTGIYDMCGGSEERIAVYYNSLDQMLKLNGLNSFAETPNKGIELIETYSKYWDKYEVGEEEKKVTKIGPTWRNIDIWNGDGSEEANKKRMDIAKEKYNLMSKKTDGTSRIGDGLYEVIKDYSYWGKFTDNVTMGSIQNGKTTATKESYGSGYYNKDFTLIGNCPQGFTRRGGTAGSDVLAGVFTLIDDDGGAYWIIGFRPVAVV